MGRPPASDARDTRQSIVDAALDLFAERGFFGTSMRELARAVGVRESAIYHHFANKEALLDALMHEAGEERAQKFEQALEAWRTLPTRALLHNVASLLMEHWEAPREQKLWRLMCIEGFRLAECDKFQMDACFRKPRQLLEKLFADLARSKRIKPVPPAIASMEFMAPMFMVRNMAASPKSFRLPEGVNPRQILEAHVAFFCDALGA
jgi:AcrR family transcriptional regulator